MSDMELPRMAASAYASTTTTAADLMRMQGGQFGGLQAQTLADLQVDQGRRLQLDDHLAALQNLASGIHWSKPTPPQQQQKPKETHIMPADTRRVVQVFLADPDPDVPLEHALLYQGEQELTDLSDQELFFNIEVKRLVEQHNEYRKTLKKRNSKDAKLEPIRIRDLKMTVVNVATF